MSSTQKAQIEAAIAAARELAAVRDARRDAAGSAAGRTCQGASTPARAVAADYLARAGLDTVGLERDLATAREENRRRADDAMAAAMSQSAAQADRLSAVVKDRQAALEALAVPGPPAAIQYTALDSPVEIWTTDQLQLASSSIIPWNSRAKVSYDGKLYGNGWQYAILEAAGTEELHFYFLWQNQRAGYAIVTVDAYLVLNGYCTVHSRGGVVDGGEAQLSADAAVDLIQTWTVPISSPVSQPGQTQRALDLAVDSHGWLSDDHTKEAFVYRGFDLRYEQAIVPPGQYLIIDASVAFNYAFLNGEVDADFASAAFDISCPFVQVAVLP